MRRPILSLLLGLASVIMLIKTFPDLRRYIKMERM